MPVPVCLDYYSFILNVKIEYCFFSNFVLFFPKTHLAILDPLHFYTNFRITLPISTKIKPCYGFGWNCSESVEQLRQVDVSAILGFLIQEHYISISI